MVNSQGSFFGLPRFSSATHHSTPRQAATPMTNPLNTIAEQHYEAKRLSVVLQGTCQGDHEGPGLWWCELKPGKAFLWPLFISRVLEYFWEQQRARRATGKARRYIRKGDPASFQPPPGLLSASISRCLSGRRAQAKRRPQGNHDRAHLGLQEGEFLFSCFGGNSPPSTTLCSTVKGRPHMEHPKI